MRTQKEQIIYDLQQRILAMQDGSKPVAQNQSMRLGAVEQAFPDGVFPTGKVHEFVSAVPEAAAATSGFIACLLNRMTKRKGFSLWISARRCVFPPALKLLGIDPESVIFIDLQNDKDVLWAVEEALRCEALIAVVGELRELNFAQSRRLQLAIEQSQVTGLIHRIYPVTESNTACVARWKITPLPGIVEPGMPGVGFPLWNVELTKVKNGRPGAWPVEWTPEGFRHYTGADRTPNIQTEKARYA